MWAVTVEYYKRGISAQKIQRLCEQYDCDADAQYEPFHTVVSYYFKSKGPARMMYLEMLASANLEWSGIIDVNMTRVS